MTPTNINNNHHKPLHRYRGVCSSSSSSHLALFGKTSSSCGSSRLLRIIWTMMPLVFWAGHMFQHHWTTTSSLAPLLSSSSSSSSASSTLVSDLAAHVTTLANAATVEVERNLSSSSSSSLPPSELISDDHDNSTATETSGLDDNGVKAEPSNTSTAESGAAAVSPPPETPATTESAPPITTTRTPVTTSTARRTSWAIFYNVYTAPRDIQLQQHARNIITEQVEQLGRSYAIRESSDNSTGSVPSTTLFYNTIGKRLDQQWFYQLAQANGMTAIHMRHYFKAYETVTLQNVQDYCHEHPDTVVVYLHNKGSFNKVNAGYDQTSFRRLITFAATHQVCLDAVSSGQCQTCGLLFQPMPALHYPGNMWAARCSYINQLSSPTTFADRMERIKDTYVSTIRPNNWLVARFFGRSSAVFGTGRYASEHWLGSHPQLTNPCHVSPLARFTDLTFNETSWQTDWPVQLISGGPGFGLEDRGWGFYNYTRCEACRYIFSNGRARRTEYCFLGGSLFKWKRLYQAIPPTDSWVWLWFPDGQYWKHSYKVGHPLFAADIYTEGDAALPSATTDAAAVAAAAAQVPVPATQVGAGEGPVSTTPEGMQLDDATMAVVKSRNMHDLLLFEWASTTLRNKRPTGSLPARTAADSDTATLPTCMVLFQIPRADIHHFTRFLRRVAAKKEWGYLRIGSKTADDLRGEVFAENKITTGLLTPAFFQFAPDAQACYRMVILRNPLDRTMTIFQSRQQPDDTFRPCFMSDTLPNPTCPGSHNYQDDMVRQLGTTSAALTVWNSTEYLRQGKVDVTFFERAKSFLADMDLVCFTDEPDECLAHVRAMLGLDPRDIMMPSLKKG